jgi:inhibitor of KinA
MMNVRVGCRLSTHAPARAPDPIAWMGERALLVRLAEEPSAEATRRVAAVAAALEDAPPPALQEIVPSYTSVLVLLDPCRLASTGAAARARRAVGRAVRRALEDLDPEGDPRGGGRLWRIPVRYGGEDGPDLEAVAAWAGLTPAEVVRLHTTPEYRVLAVGFRPGYPFLGFVDERIAAPRREVHRQRVEAGAVGIAGRQTGIYPRASSGGWQIVGRTDVPLFDPSAPSPEAASRLRVGDRVRFVPEAVRA